MLKTKKIAIAAIAAVFACSAALAGCSSNTAPPNENSGESSSVVDETSNAVSEKLDELKNDNEAVDEEATGSWTVPATKADNLLSEEAQAVFDKADFEVDYSPVSLLATQVVAGTNYAFLCQKPALSPTMPEKWYVVVLYEDLKGNVEVTAESPLNQSDVAVTKEAEGDAVGAWEAAVPEVAASLPDEVEEAFESALPASGDISLTPVALLGEQVVAGENYRILCVGKTVKGAKADELFVADIYVPWNGGAQLTDISLFDLIHYIEAGGDRSTEEIAAGIAKAGEAIVSGAVAGASELVEAAKNANEDDADNRNGDSIKKVDENGNKQLTEI